MQTISIISRKGGVGKTATAQTLGAGLIKIKKRVLYIDLDGQCNLSFGLNADLNAVSSREVLTGEADITDAIQRTENGDVIPGAEELNGMDAVLTEIGKEYRLKEALNGIQGAYDYCVIDTPANLGILTINALTASDRIIIPVQADTYSLQGLGRLKTSIDAVKAYTNPDLQVQGILITRYNGRAIISRDMLESLEQASGYLDTSLYEVPIRECISIREAQDRQTDIFSYAPKSNASRDYQSFIREFIERG